MPVESNEIVPQSTLPTLRDVSAGLAFSSLNPSLISTESSASSVQHQPPIALHQISSEFRDEPYRDRQTAVIRPKTDLKAVKFLTRFNFILSLDNEGSTARDHLANERTVLAWIRTSLSFATVGVGVVQLYNLIQTKSGEDWISRLAKVKRFRRPLGTGFLLIATLTVCLGLYRYFIIQERLGHQRFPVARLSIIIVLISTFALIVTALVATIKFQFG